MLSLYAIGWPGGAKVWELQTHLQGRNAEAREVAQRENEMAAGSVA